MPTEKKLNIVSELEDTMAKSTVVILSQYRGVKASQLSNLRRKLRSANSEIRVVKNTLARIAANKSGKSAIVKSLEGPMAITFGYGDIVAPVKVLISSQTELEGMVVTGGLLGDKMYSKAEILSLATLPPKEVLIGRVLGQMNAPVSRLVGTLTSPMRGILGVLQARIKQLEEKQ
jgi:large subunit ribosomal protein L10